MKEVIVEGTFMSTAEIPDKDVKKIERLMKKTGGTFQDCANELYENGKISLSINWEDADGTPDRIINIFRM